MVELKMLPVLTIASLILVVSLTRGRCPQNSNDTLNLTTPLGGALKSEVIGRTDVRLELHCCTLDKNMLLWYRRFNIKGMEPQWKLYPWYPHSLKSVFFLEESRNQTLILDSPLLDYDDGSFKCIATDLTSGSSVEHVVNVILNDCQNHDVPLPYPMLNSPQSVRLGQNKTVLCQGDFGCLREGTSERLAYWRRDNVTMSIVNNKKFHIYNNYSLEKEIVGSSLTIMNIEADDLASWYECVLDGGQPGSQFVSVLQLKLAVEGEEVLIVGYKWLVFVVVLPFMLGVILLIWKLCGAQIRFFSKSRCCKDVRQDGDFKYDAAIIHLTDEDPDEDAMVDMEFANEAEKTFRTRLEKYGFRCFTSRSICPNQNILRVCVESIHRSSSVVFIVTRFSLEDSTFQHIINEAVQKTHNILCLIVSSPELPPSKRINVKTVKEKYPSFHMVEWPVQPKTCKLLWSSRMKNCCCTVCLKLSMIRPIARTIKSPMDLSRVNLTREGNCV